MQMPEGVCALYFQMPWGDVLRLYAPGAPASNRPFTHALCTTQADAVLYALGQRESITDKRDLYYKMVGNGLIERA